MKKQTHTRFVKRMFVLALFAVIAVSVAAFTQKNEGASTPLPQGLWTLNCSPYMTAGYEYLPVLVTSVTSEIKGGAAITQVKVKNATSRSISAVKLAWYLSPRDERTSILQSGQTSMVDLPEEIPAGATREVKFPVISFAKIHKPLLRNGVLYGEYRIQVAVSEVRFSDGSAQTILSSRNGSTPTMIIKAAHRTISNETFCPDQECSLVRSSKDVPLGYTCRSATGTGCTNVAGGESCTDSICQQ